MRANVTIEGRRPSPWVYLTGDKSTHFLLPLSWRDRLALLRAGSVEVKLEGRP